MNLFELFVKIGVDDQASDEIDSLSSKFKNGLTTAVKVADTAIIGLGTAAINSYSEFEQLAGGAGALLRLAHGPEVGEDLQCGEQCDEHHQNRVEVKRNCLTEKSDTVFTFVYKTCNCCSP